MNDNIANLLFAAGSDLGPFLTDTKVGVVGRNPSSQFIRTVRIGTSGMMEALGSSVNQINGDFIASSIPSLLSIVNVYSTMTDPMVAVSQDFYSQEKKKASDQALYSL